MVLDIRMPGMDGVEALGRIHDMHRTMPVILNTAYSGYEENFMTWTADAYVVKSGDVSVLKERIKEVLGRVNFEDDDMDHGESLEDPA